MALDDRAFEEPVARKGAGQRKRAGEIVDAAARVFAERGYHGTSTRDIADALGLRQASVYYYFPSKEAALESVCEHGVQGFVEIAETIVASHASPREKLDRLIAAHLAPIETRRDYVRVFINERRYLPLPSRRRIGKVSRRLEQLFQRVIERGIRDAEFRAGVDARVATLAILGMLNAVINWRSEELERGTAELAADFSRIVIAGLHAGETRAEPRRRRRSRGATPRRSGRG